MSGADTICVGAIAGAFGVRGEARIKSFCADPEMIASYGPLTAADGRRRFALTLLRPIKGGFAARLDGVADKEAADALRGVRLYAPRDRLPSLPDDEFYHADLIGLAAVDTGGAALGHVRRVENFGAGDYLEIVGGGRASLLAPFTRVHAPTVDLAAGRIVIDLPEEDGSVEDAPGGEAS